MRLCSLVCREFALMGSDGHLTGDYSFMGQPGSGPQSLELHLEEVLVRSWIMTMTKVMMILLLLQLWYTHTQKLGDITQSRTFDMVPNSKYCMGHGDTLQNGHHSIFSESVV